MGETGADPRLAVFTVTVPASALLVLFDRTFRLVLGVTPSVVLGFLLGFVMGLALGLGVGSGCAGGWYLSASFRRSPLVSLLNAGSSPTTRAFQT